MNERIKELALQAGLINYIDNETPRRYFVSGNADLEEVEEFAQLIVQECIDLGKQVQSQKVTNGSEEYIAGREMGAEVFMNHIKKHFGVK